MKPPESEQPTKLQAEQQSGQQAAQPPESDHPQAGGDPAAVRAVIRNPLLRTIVFSCGCLSVALGVIGIFLPVMPTTPFLLLAAACFVRTSPKFYQWLLAHPHLSKYVMYYLGDQGMPVKAKVYTLILMWTSLLLTSFVFTDRLSVQIVLPLIGLGVSVYLWRLPTLKINKSGADV